MPITRIRPSDVADASSWKEEALAEYVRLRTGYVADRVRCLKQADIYAHKAKAAEEAILQLDGAARIFGLRLSDIVELSEQETVPTVPFRSGPMFKDVVLDLLKAAYPRALRASQIKSDAETRLGRPFHAKTTGMSLYRLAKDGMVERHGWDWFFVPEDKRKQRQQEIAELPEFDIDLSTELGGHMQKTK